MKETRTPTGLPNRRNQQEILRNRQSVVSLGSAPPCNIHQSQAYREAQTITVTVQRIGTEWQVSPKEPIKLENDNDAVHWNLDALVDFYGSLANVKIEFTQGPSGFDSTKGPFSDQPLFSASNGNGTASITVTGRNNLYGDCYCYNLWVHRADDPYDLHVERLFPVDPQVDNLMPPPPPSPPPSPKERRPR